MAWWNRHATRGPAMIPETKTPPTEPLIKAAQLDPTFYPIIQNFGTAFPGDYAHIYRSQPAVRTVVNFLSRNIAQLNLKVYARISDQDRVELDSHPLARLLRAPNPDTTKYRLFRDLVADIAIEDVAYWWKIRNPSTGRVERLYRVPLSRLDRSTVGTSIVYRLVQTGQEIPRDDLVIFPGFSPCGDPWGVSPMETLRRVLMEAWASDEHRRGYWQNSARREGVIKRPANAPEWSDTARERFREDWQNRHAGARNAGKTPILEDDMDWVADSFSPRESEYIEGRRLIAEEVARAYGIAPKLLGITGDDTNANIQAFHRQLYQDNLGPWLKAIEDEIELQLLPELDSSNSAGQRTYVEFNLAEKLKGSFEEQASVLATTVGVPSISVNEGRARLNLSRIDDEAFDVPVKPLNVLYGGQASTQTPTATPGSPPSEMPGQPSLRSMKADVPRAVERRRSSAADDYTERLTKYFRRQERAYLAFTQRKQKGSKADWDDEKWDADLTSILFAESVPLASATGKRAARQMRGVYREEETIDYIASSSRISAQSINGKTMSDLAGKDNEGILHVFEVAKGSRAEHLGLGLATSVINFARNDAARQSTNDDGRQRTKTWVVTSSNSRHPEMDGETVPISENFSNGLAWPGDASGDTDEIAGCHCLVDFS